MLSISDVEHRCIISIIVGIIELAFDLVKCIVVGMPTFARRVIFSAYTPASDTVALAVAVILDTLGGVGLALGRCPAWQ